MPIKIVPLEELKQDNPGEFNLILRDGICYGPVDLVETFYDNKIRTVERLIDYLESFPLSVAAFMDWNMSEVISAALKLGAVLKDAVPSLKIKADSQSFGRGALPPSTIR